MACAGCASRAGLTFAPDAALPWGAGAGAHRRSGACAGNDRALGGGFVLYWEGTAGWLKVCPVGACATTLEGGFALYWEGTAGRLKVCPVGACAATLGTDAGFREWVIG